MPFILAPIEQHPKRFGVALRGERAAILVHHDQAERLPVALRGPRDRFDRERSASNGAIGQGHPSNPAAGEHRRELRRPHPVGQPGTSGGGAEGGANHGARTPELGDQVMLGHQRRDRPVAKRRDQLYPTRRRHGPDPANDLRPVLHEIGDPVAAER